MRNVHHDVLMSRGTSFDYSAAEYSVMQVCLITIAPQFDRELIFTLSLPF